MGFWPTKSGNDYGEAGELSKTIFFSASIVRANAQANTGVPPIIFNGKYPKLFAKQNNNNKNSSKIKEQKNEPDYR